MPDAKTIHWRLPPNYLEPGTLLAVLRKHLSKGAEVAVTQRATVTIEIVE